MLRRILPQTSISQVAAKRMLSSARFTVTGVLIWL
jgi:hypothetical protein